MILYSKHIVITLHRKHATDAELYFALCTIIPLKLILSILISLQIIVFSSMSLKGLALSYLNVSMNKSKRIQCSDWDAHHLSQEQV